MIDVVAAILENKEGKILIAKRKQGKKLAGYWEFPGGKIEKGEKPEQSLSRELYEEMNLEVEVGAYVGENIHEYDEGAIRLLAYSGTIVGGEVALKDHEECRWVERRDLKDMKLAPADIPFIKLLEDEKRC